MLVQESVAPHGSVLIISGHSEARSRRLSFLSFFFRHCVFPFRISCHVALPTCRSSFEFAHVPWRSRSQYSWPDAFRTASGFPALLSSFFILCFDVFPYCSDSGSAVTRRWFLPNWNRSGGVSLSMSRQLLAWLRFGSHLYFPFSTARGFNSSFLRLRLGFSQLLRETVCLWAMHPNSVRLFFFPCPACRYIPFRPAG